MMTRLNLEGRDCGTATVAVPIAFRSSIEQFTTQGHSVALTMKREQTTLRTVRISRELDNAVEIISKERGLSVNSFDQ